MPYVDFKKLKARVSIVDILKRYGMVWGLNPIQYGYEGICPFCQTHGFRVVITTDRWGCGGGCNDTDHKNGGDIVEFVARKEGVDLKKAAELINDWFPEGEQQRFQAENFESMKNQDEAFDSVLGEFSTSPDAGKPQEAANNEAELITTQDAMSNVVRRLEKSGWDLKLLDQMKQEALDYLAEQGNTNASPVVRSTHTDDPVGPIYLESQDEATGERLYIRSDDPRIPTENKPLDLILKDVDPDHQAVIDAGIDPDVAERYGVGFFAGKGNMHNRIVFPWYDEDGRVLAYCGYGAKDGSWTYPPPNKFNPTLELWGFYHAQNRWVSPEDLAIARSPLDALRLMEKVPNSPVVAITTSTFSTAQWTRLETFIKPDSKVLLAAPAEDQDVPDILAPLLDRYYVRLVRY